jgi:hypothetical protein
MGGLFIREVDLYDGDGFLTRDSDPVAWTCGVFGE